MRKRLNFARLIAVLVMAVVTAWGGALYGFASHNTPPDSGGSALYERYNENPCRCAEIGTVGNIPFWTLESAFQFIGRTYEDRYYDCRGRIAFSRSERHNGLENRSDQQFKRNYPECPCYSERHDSDQSWGLSYSPESWRWRDYIFPVLSNKWLDCLEESGNVRSIGVSGKEVRHE